MGGSLPSGLLISALLKRVNDAGGMGMVRARGDAESGTMLFILNEPDVPSRLVEPARGHDERTLLVATGPTDPKDFDGYWRKRRMHDPDLWVIELDIAAAERFAAETILPG